MGIPHETQEIISRNVREFKKSQISQNWPVGFSSNFASSYRALCWLNSEISEKLQCTNLKISHEKWENVL